jgi:hypothetical protein
MAWLICLNTPNLCNLYRILPIRSFFINSLVSREIEFPMCWLLFVDYPKHLIPDIGNI